MICRIMQKSTIALPIDKFRKEIESVIARNPVTLITAETGAGKSTRVPFWLWKKGKRVQVTQPRRIAARSLPHYLAKMNGITLGKEIGYQTGFDSRKSRETNLLYVTDGVQMVQEIKGSRRYDVLVLDEVHEWNLNQEVLIGIVKKNLESGHLKRSGQRVVIMSATLQATQLSAFLDNAPIIEVPGRGFPVTMHHNNPHFLLPDTAQMVELERNVLVFQPGKNEIKDFMESLKDMLDAEKVKAKILPLHSELTLQEQSKVFEHYPIPKVIVATDIAQTSLTIDDIDAVVDTGIKKEVRVVKGIEGLYPADISTAECMQRAGRAGRVKNGQYFLCAEGAVEERLPFPEPEIRRLNLDNVVLRLIQRGISPLEFPFFHSPQRSLIFKAIRKLKAFGAITEDEKVTRDGSKMADLPVSLRSAKLVMEAMKSGPRVLDSAIKLIAILETRGITNKEYTGEKYSSAPFHSDLLNQLAIWQTARANKKVINQKKFAMAREIYRELRKRLDAPPVKGHAEPPGQHIKMLYRAILSAFVDELHLKVGDEYQRENEARQLDRTSTLYAYMPEMLVGMPFDLIISREKPETGEKEERFIPLVTFASELSIPLLDELKPYSYEKREEVAVKNNKLVVQREYYYGQRLIRAFEATPDFENPEEMAVVVKTGLKWYWENPGKFGLNKAREKLTEIFPHIQEVVKEELKSFDTYWSEFITREMTQHLKIDDLTMFFSFHKGFNHISLGDLLPGRIIKILRNSRWPATVNLNDVPFKLLYIQRKPFVKLDYSSFEKVTEEELILATGDVVGIIMGKRKFRNWDQAVDEFNRWKRKNIFEKKLEGSKKNASVEYMMDIPFPQKITAGQGKNNIPLEYFTVPLVEKDELFLKYFLDEEEAKEYYSRHEQVWQKFIKNHKKRKIENIFKEKGWKVKP